jgi:hypothetical protein
MTTLSMALLLGNTCINFHAVYDRELLNSFWDHDENHLSSCLCSMQHGSCFFCCIAGPYQCLKPLWYLILHMVHLCLMRLNPGLHRRVSCT